MQEPVDGAADAAAPAVAGADEQPAQAPSPLQAHAAVPSPVPATPENIDVAAAVLRGGGLVAIPTETVYGLAADARNAEALTKLYKVKGRPGTHPVIVHISDAAGLAEWAREVPDYARALAEKFWPGPLTLVLPRAEFVSDAVTGGQDSVGLRVPAHPVAQQLLQKLDGPTDESASGRYFGLAAPSANRFGRISPTAAEHVRADLGAAIGTEVDMVLDGGTCEVGIESTIVDCTGPAPIVLRPGRISAADIAAVAATVADDAGSTNTDTDPDTAPTSETQADGPTASETTAPKAKTRAPGTLAAHYAPRAKLRLLKRSGIIEAVTTHRGGSRVAALALEIPVARLSASLSIVVPAVAASYARDLYANLRLLDAAGADVILVESPPDTPVWSAVLDRLRRAETKEVPKRRKAGMGEPAQATSEATPDATPVTPAASESASPQSPAEAA